MKLKTGCSPDLRSFIPGVPLIRLEMAPSPPSTLTCPQRRLAHSSALLLRHLLLSCGRSHRSSGSVCPPTPAVGDQPRSCQVLLGVALPLPSLSIQPSIRVFLSFLLHTRVLFFPHVSVCFCIYFFCIQERTDLLRLAPPFFDFYLHLLTFALRQIGRFLRAHFHQRREMMWHDACGGAVRKKTRSPI